MVTSNLPMKPVALSGQQAEAMAQRQIKKHHVAIMLLHWFNATVWLAELATGTALISSPHFRIVPYWYINLIQGFFGTRADMLRFHITVGLVWIAVFLVYGTFGFRTYLAKQVLQREIGLDRDDFRWLKIRTLRLLRRTQEHLPPQGVYNAGQKMFALMVYAMIPLIMATGLVMSFHLISTTVVGFAVVLHFVAVGMVVSGLMIHVYMGAVFPEEKPAFFSMITGTVNELYAYRHHFKWWREMKMREAEWEQGIEEELAQANGTVVARAAMPETAVPEETRGAAPAAPGLLTRVFRQPGYWPPYAAGFGLGVTLLLTFVIMGQGLGASGGFTRYLVAFLSWIAPGYANSNAYWSNYLQPGQSPLIDFLVFELIGAALGGFVSGWLAHRTRLAVDKGPRISATTRYALALGGGILTGLGARLARGCTSGLALSGGAVLSVGAFAFMLSVFAAGFAGAYFLRRFWL
ncbi:MAG: cytochrome b/b6 domain-containing protein [Chlamydiota bacterium]